MYNKLGYTEVDIIPTNFNDILDIKLMLPELFLGK